MQNPADVSTQSRGVKLVCFALSEEAGPFQKIAAGKTEVSILITGIGRRNAQTAVREFLGIASVPDGAVDDSKTANKKANDVATFVTRDGARAPQFVFTCGFAGGLNPDLKLGDVLFEIHNPQSAIRNHLISAGAKSAKFFCSDRFVLTAAEKKALRVQTGADAVEMESEAIHAVCRQRGIPCATVRVISDPADEDLPLDFNRLVRPDMSFDYGKLVRAVAKSPGKIPALLRLHRRCHFAAERLAAVLAGVIWPS